MEEQLPPRVSALIISRDSESELRQCLAALEASNGRDRLEIVVVDDGSEDGSSAVADDFPNVVSLKLPKRFGWTRAVNIGLRTAKGDLILLLPPWYLSGPETIAGLADRLEAASDVGAVCPRIERAWPFPAPESLLQAWRTGELAGSRAVSSADEDVDYPGIAPILLRRELLRAMNYLDQRFGDKWADLEMCSRIRGGGKKIRVCSDIPVTRLAEPAQSVTPAEWADSANGVATWIGLHFGWFSGLRARLSMAFHALGRGNTSTFTRILSWSKIDGNQE